MKNRIKLLIFAAALVMGTSVTSVHAQPDSTFKPHGMVSGQIFFDYAYQIGADTTASRGKGYYSSSPKDAQAFDIRRVYLGYDYWFSPSIAAGILLAHEPKVAPPASNGATNNNLLSDNTNGFYLKGANIRFMNAIPMATVIIGQQPTPSFQLSEQVWAYRSIEKTLLDFRGAEGSNDMGAAINGTFDNDGNFGYKAMIGNGTNQKNETNKFKKYYGDLWAKFLDKKIVVEVFADADYTGVGSNDTNKTTTMKAFVAWQSDPITIGLEYASQVITTENKQNVVPGGLSVFLRGPIMEKTLGFFARFDMWNPDQHTDNTGFTENFITAGLDWQPVSNVHIEPNLWMETYKDRSAAAIDRKSDVVGRVTFYAKL